MKTKVAITVAMIVIGFTIYKLHTKKAEVVAPVVAEVPTTTIPAQPVEVSH